MLPKNYNQKKQDEEQAQMEAAEQTAREIEALTDRGSAVFRYEILAAVQGVALALKENTEAIHNAIESFSQPKQVTQEEEVVEADDEFGMPEELPQKPPRKK